jgi:hypothetical protein
MTPAGVAKGVVRTMSLKLVAKAVAPMTRWAMCDRAAVRMTCHP